MKTVVLLSSLLSKGMNYFWALRELGVRQVLPYAAYKASMRSGIARQRVHKAMQYASRNTGPLSYDLITLPEPSSLHTCLGPAHLQLLLVEANEICAGSVRLFGGKPVPLQLDLPKEKRPWTDYEGIAWMEGIGDIKFVWEPGRFGWAVILARAYHLSQDPRYAAAFWQWTETFFAANPPGFGPHWVSAQEVSLRLICLVFAWQVFANAPGNTPERAASLAQWVAIHAARIPPTLSYARAQNNNHLLSEAAGLYTASLALPAHRQAKRWRESGWRWLNKGLVDQIDRDGAYIQHSTNYQRLALQLALWCNTLAVKHGDNFLPEVSQRLKAATRWMIAILDPLSGQVPNLGPNDGAYILPLSTCAFSDHRPVLQAAGNLFGAGAVCPAGAWDEMALWYGLRLNTSDKQPQPVKQSKIQTRTVMRSASGKTWAYLRAAHFSGRPGHADQLHLDLWQNGLNLALDAGTYLYNAPSPWDNRLAEAFVHNTVTVEGQDQMQRIGRFLYLRGAQAEITEDLSQPRQDWERLVARHNGYRRLGMLHIRSVERQGQHWLVHDQIIPDRGQDDLSTSARLHWLLPDLPWDLAVSDSSILLRLDSANSHTSLKLSANSELVSFLLVRAGELLAGTGELQPTWGWVSPTYGVKLPALSLSLTARGKLPIEFTTAWDVGED